MLAVVLAALLQSATAAPPMLKGPDALRDYARAAEKARDQPPPTAGAFVLDLPLTSDRKTDIASLQRPAGWSYDAQTQVLTIDVDFGAVTPLNYADFDAQGLARLPPLRTVFFDTRATRDTTYRTVQDARGDVGQTQGWVNYTSSYGLAIATSAKAFGSRGGDLPDDFSLPFVMRMKARPDAASTIVRGLRLRFSGELRTLGGRAVMCSRDKGGAYQVDQFTQTTPNVVTSRQCFLPAVLDSVALVRATDGAVLKSWTRGDRPMTAQTPETEVIMAGDRRLAQAPILSDAVSSSPNATPTAAQPRPTVEPAPPAR